MNKKEEKITMIREFSEAKAPSGFEDEALEVSRKYAEGLDQPHTVMGWRPADNYYAIDMGGETILWFPEHMLSRALGKERG